MKTFWISIICCLAIGLKAQNSGAQYISGNKHERADSAKSEYHDDPAKHAHEEVITLKNDKGGNRVNGGGSGVGNRNNSSGNAGNADNSGGMPADSSSITSGSGAAQAITPNAESTMADVSQPCEQKMGWGHCIGCFILGVILGALIMWLVGKNRRKDDNRAMR